MSEKLLPLGANTQELSAQTLNYIKQRVDAGERKKGVVFGRIQEIDRMIKHLQGEKLNLERSIITLGEKYKIGDEI